MAAAVALLFAGCGGDDEEAGPSGAGQSTLKIEADPDGKIAFTETKLTAKAGSVTVEFANASQVPHAVEIEGNGVEEETETVTAQDAPPLTVDLKAGEYEFYCPVGDHRAEGMTGTLTVS
jgi:plastocyanin